MILDIVKENMYVKRVGQTISEYAILNCEWIERMSAYFFVIVDWEKFNPKGNNVNCNH
jgi:hypothetical protein